MYKPFSFFFNLHCTSIIRRFSLSSAFAVDVSIVLALLVLFPVDIDTISRRLCSVSLTTDEDLSRFVADTIVPVRYFVPLFIIVDECRSLVSIECFDESITVCVDVVKSFSVVVDINDDIDDVDDVKILFELVDFVAMVNELRVGNKR